VGLDGIGCFFFLVGGHRMIMISFILVRLHLLYIDSNFLEHFVCVLF
jgi:hypothetical protein